MNARGVDFTGIAYLIALGVGSFVVYRLVQSVPSVKAAVGNAVDAVKSAAGVALQAVNPVNPDNLANRGFEAVVKAATGRTVADWFPGGNPDGSQVLAQFNAADQDDADLGKAMRSARLRGENLFATAADQEDSDIGAAMAAATGSPFISYQKMTRGIIR